LGQCRKAQWRKHCNNNVYGFCKDVGVETHVKLRRLEWAGHICQMDESRMPRNILERKIYMVAKQQGSQKTGRWTWYPEYC
jgi:hypothetical protein